jgi:hypothetical protein
MMTSRRECAGEEKEGLNEEMMSQQMLHHYCFDCKHSENQELRLHAIIRTAIIL